MENNYQKTAASSCSIDIMSILANPRNEEDLEPWDDDDNLSTMKSANQWCDEAFMRPDPKQLWGSLWNEGELCCLFADSNTGKSIYAMQIASKIAETQPVVYWDFEMSDKQLQLRYTDEQTKIRGRFPANLMRCELNAENINPTDFEERIMRHIERRAVEAGAQVVIIDNLTYLCSKSEQPDSASQLMMRLVELKKRQGLSLLVLAHTPKRIMSNPLTQNDLAGSKRLFNFFDSCFAMGKSSKDEEMRYIKQIKVRAGRFEYGSENVIVGEFERVNGFLQFVEKGFSTEQVHLIADSEKAQAQFAESVKELMHTGLSLHKIATQLGVSYAKVQRIAKRNSLS